LEKLIEAGPEGIHQLWQALHIKNYGQKKAQALYTNVKLSMYTFDEIRMYKKPTLKTRDSLTQNKA
jgi:hypothetical protein